MKTLKRVMKIAVAGCLAVMLTVSATGCSGKANLGGKEKIDVVMWNCLDDYEKDQSGNSMLRYGANKFSLDEGVDVNLIVIDANTYEEFNTKRNALFLLEDKPEIIMFHSSEENSVVDLEDQGEALMPLDDYLKNKDDVLKGFYSDRLVSVAVLVLASASVNTIGDTYIPSYKNLLVSTADYKRGWMKWAKESGTPFNLLDLESYMYPGVIEFCAYKDNKVTLDATKMLEAIKLTSDFIHAMPTEQKIEGEAGAQYLSFKDQTLIQRDFDLIRAATNQRFSVRILSLNINAMDAIEVGQSITKTETPVVVEGALEIRYMGLALVAEESTEQANAIKFANYLLSPEFQASMPSAISAKGTMNGSVLRSVNDQQIKQAENEDVLANGKPIPKRVLDLKRKLLAQFDMPGVLLTKSMMTSTIKLYEAYHRLVAEYACGMHTDDAYFVEQIKQLEDDVNLMLNE